MEKQITTQPQLADTRSYLVNNKIIDCFTFYDELEMLNFRFEELYESQFPERLQAQYKKNMNGGIMAQNTQTGIDGIPDKFDI